MLTVKLALPAVAVATDDTYDIETVAASAVDVDAAPES